MPARFVEVASPLNLADAARKSDALSMFSNAGLGRFSSFNFTDGFHTKLNGSSTIGFDLRAPEGAARVLLGLACALWVLRMALLHSATKRAVSLYGHARAE